MLGTKKTQPIRIEEIDADTLVVRLAAWKTHVVDVRETAPCSGGRIPEALSIPLSELASSVRGLPRQTSLALVCETGAESIRAAGILWDLGFRDLAILRGGFTNHTRFGLPVTS